MAEQSWSKNEAWSDAAGNAFGYSGHVFDDGHAEIRLFAKVVDDDGIREKTLDLELDPKQLRVLSELAMETRLIALEKRQELEKLREASAG